MVYIMMALKNLGTESLIIICLNFSRWRTPSHMRLSHLSINMKRMLRPVLRSQVEGFPKGASTTVMWRHICGRRDNYFMFLYATIYIPEWNKLTVMRLKKTQRLHSDVISVLKLFHFNGARGVIYCFTRCEIMIIY